jgi:hypothetical protein
LAAKVRSIGYAGPVSIRLLALLLCSRHPKTDWPIAPKHLVLGASGHYRRGTLVLETEFQTASGHATIADFIPPGDSATL